MTRRDHWRHRIEPLSLPFSYTFVVNINLEIGYFYLKLFSVSFSLVYFLPQALKALSFFLNEEPGSHPRVKAWSIGFMTKLLIYIFAQHIMAVLSVWPVMSVVSSSLTVTRIWIKLLIYRRRRRSNYFYDLSHFVSGISSCKTNEREGKRERMRETKSKLVHKTSLKLVLHTQTLELVKDS